MVTKPSFEDQLSSKEAKEDVNRPSKSLSRKGILVAERKHRSGVLGRV